MTHVLRVPDKELVATAGIDALAFIRVCQFGIQLFFPITVLSVCVFIPVHVSGSALDQEREDFLKLGGSAEKLTYGLSSRLMRTTAANIDDADKVMWLHVVTNWLIVGYATWLLRRHTRTFALLRQLYLTTAGDTNLWRAVHMPTTILQQMLVQGREVEAEMDVRAMREQVASRDMRRGGDAGAREGEDEDDAFQDADARLDGPANDFSPRSSVKKKKKFQTKPDTSSGFEISKATSKGSDGGAGGAGAGGEEKEKEKEKRSSRREEDALEDGFEFDFGGSETRETSGSAGLSRFAPATATSPDHALASTETDASQQARADSARDSVTIDVAGRGERKQSDFSPTRSATARVSLSYAGARESARFSDDMADITVSAGKRVHAKPVRVRGQEGDGASRHREPRAGAEKSLVNMSIEAMAFLATPVLQQSQVKRVVGPKRAGPAIELPGSRDPAGMNGKNVPGAAIAAVPESAEEGAEASSSPRLSLGEKSSAFRGELHGAVSASAAFDGVAGRDARRSRGGLKELRNNIKGLKKQQAAKAKAAARGGLSTLGGEPQPATAGGERGETPRNSTSMAGAANDAYATPGLPSRGSSMRARVSLEDGYVPPGVSSGASAGKEARERDALRPRRESAPSAAEPSSATPEPTTSPSPPKKKKLKVPKGMRIGLQAAKLKVAAKRDEPRSETSETAVREETAAGSGGGEAGGGSSMSDQSSAAAPGDVSATNAAVVLGPDSSSDPPPPPSRPPPPDLASPPAGMRIGLASRRTKVPAAERPEISQTNPGPGPGPGPVTESFDGGAPTRETGDAGSGDARRATAPPYASESAARPPTVYAGRDGTPTVYFGPGGGEGAARRRLPPRGGTPRTPGTSSACVRTARAPRPRTLPTPLPAPRGSRGTRRTCPPTRRRRGTAAFPASPDAWTARC